MNERITENITRKFLEEKGFYDNNFIVEEQKSKKTFHQIDDVLKQIKYINNIENQILLYNSPLLKG